MCLVDAYIRQTECCSLSQCTFLCRKRSRSLQRKSITLRHVITRSSSDQRIKDSRGLWRKQSHRTVRASAVEQSVRQMRRSRLACGTKSCAALCSGVANSILSQYVQLDFANQELIPYCPLRALKSCCTVAWCCWLREAKVLAETPNPH